MGLLRAAGLRKDEQHLGKMFGALLIAANARHLLVGATTDIIIFRTSGARKPAAAVTEVGLAAVRRTAQIMSEDALRSLCRSRGKSLQTLLPPEPHWEKMNVMTTLGITHDFITGLPLLDTSDVTNPSSGLSKEEQDELKSGLSRVLHDLADSLKSDCNVDPTPSLAEFQQSLAQYRACSGRKRLRPH